MNSTHRAIVVPIELLPHNNSDNLSIVKVWGYPVVVRTADWQGVTQGVYLPPDSILPDRPEYAWLNGKLRIKACKLRGVLSFGLLIPAPEDAELWEDVTDRLGITHYEPPVQNEKMGGEAGPGPPGYHVKHDVDSIRRYNDLINEGEPVFVSEKIHGANFRITYRNDQLWVGSRTEWKRYNPDTAWWRVVESYPEVVEFLKSNQDVTLYGEMYGNVQSLKYGCNKGELKLAFFDLMKLNVWAGPLEAREAAPSIPWVPELYRGPFDWAKMEELSEGPSLVTGANHYREGCVVELITPRYDVRVGRVKLKLVSATYLIKN
jgi:RNA ligase (TIGR02306 family)